MGHMEQRVAVPRAEVDTSQFPVVVVSERGVLSDEERVALMEALEELIERRGRHVLVLDLRRAGVVPHTQRTYIAEALQLRSDEIAEKWAGMAILVQSPVLTHLPKAAFWLNVSPVPSRMFGDRGEAMTWARGCVTLASSGAIPIGALAEAKDRTGR